MRKILSIVAAVFMLMIAGVAPSFAEAPAPSISSNITDKSGSLDKAQMDLLVNQVEAETDYELYVYVTDTFDGMSGAQWAVETAKKSHLDASNAVLFTIATKDRKYGSAFPTGSVIASNITKVEAEAIPSLKKNDWNSAVAAYGNALMQNSHAVAAAKAQNGVETDKATAGLLGILGNIAIFIVGAVALGVAGLFGFKGIRKVRETFATNRRVDGKVRSLKESVPAFITAVDNKLNDLTAQTEFATVMYGADRAETTQGLVKSASKRLQKAITMTGNGSGVKKNRSEMLNDLRFAESELQVADKYLDNAAKNITDMKAEQDGLEAQEASVKESVQRLIAKEDGLNAEVKDLQKNFDEAFIADAVKASKDFSAKVAEVSLLVSRLADKDGLTARQSAVSDAVAAVKGAEKSAVTVTRLVKKAVTFRSFVEEEVTARVREMDKNSAVNAKADMVALVATARKALEDAEAVDCTKGNPKEALLKALAPFEAYVMGVGAYSAKANKVSASKSIVLSIIGQKEGELLTFVSDLSERTAAYIGDRVALNKDAKLAIATLKDLKVQVKAIEAYDVAEVEKFAEAVNVFVGDLTKRFAKSLSLIAAEKAEEERRRVEEERRRRQAAEELARQRRVEEERRRKKRQQEEEEAAAHRRRSSYSSSSSSYSSYGGGYSSSYDSGSSSSSFSSSGGSFGDSGSGGSF
jgi:uncharacterized membrane protein YgcG